jgi:hypothetical protein
MEGRAFRRARNLFGLPRPLQSFWDKTGRGHQQVIRVPHIRDAMPSLAPEKREAEISPEGLLQRIKDRLIFASCAQRMRAVS